MRNKSIYIIRCVTLLIVTIVVVMLSSCSTTRRIPQGELLYNGMSIHIDHPEGERLPDQLKSDLTTSVNVKPNNPWPLISPYKRSPLPIGLWVYNNWNDSAKGLKGWLYDKLVAQPVLVSDVKPETRLKMLKSILHNNGYFDSSVSYELLNREGSKKGKLDYQVETGTPYSIDTIVYFNDDSSAIKHFIDSVARKSRYLVKGERFCVDSLSAERVRIANAMRNKGYYYFRPEFIEFLADSVSTPKSIGLKMVLSDKTPHIATLKWKTGKVHTTLLRRSKRKPGTPDTLQTKRGELVVYRPQHLRENLIPSCISFREGRTFSVRQMDRTQTRLSRLGIFGSIDIQPVPVDTTDENPTLDVYITCRYERPIEASIEMNLTSKSNSYLGPGLIFGLTHHNLFGGAEVLNLQLNGSYEWQTGRNKSSVLNSYELGVSASLAFPRLLAPNWIRRTKRELNWTTISLKADFLNRPHYFRMAEFSTGITYDWNHNRNVTNQFTPFKISYTKLLKTTETFDSIMRENPAVALSFQSQFIPEMSYTYNYDKWLERAKNNGFHLQFTVKEGGNIFWGLWRMCGVKGQKELFGMPFSQFVKAQAQLTYNHRLIAGMSHWLVARLFVGGAHAYGNSSEVPYSEQFYIGGANSIRAFTVRSVGPGCYHAPKSDKNGYFDQTGTFKLEMNAEYRFPIFSIIHGALFVDAGNIWLLKDDPQRPGGTIDGKRFFKDLALGTGVGLRIDLGMLVIRGDLGYGLHAPYDTGSGGYFNIKPKNAFAFHLAIGYPF